MDEIVEMAKNLQEELRAHRRTIHGYAEVDMDLPKTSAYVKARLTEMGLEPYDVGPCGVAVLIGGKKPGKVVLLRADMDALLGQELSGLEFQATNGHMHACGHDLHTAMLLGAAKVLKSMEDRIQGTIKLMFQPGEETLNGAKAMVEAGILDNPKVDAAMMLHVFSGLPFDSGCFMIPEAGPVSASSDKFDIVIQGKGGHGAMPNFGVDPLNVACHTHLALQEIIAREVAATDPAVVTVGYLQGGQANNVIPDSAKLGGTVRTFSVANRDFIEKRLPEIVQNVATTFRASASVSYVWGCPSVVMDKALRNDFVEIINRRFGPDAFVKGAPFDKMMGSEDFSFVTEKVPSIMVALTAGDARKGMTFAQHHPKVLFDEEVLYRGTAAYAAFAFDWLAGHGV